MTQAPGTLRQFVEWAANRFEQAGLFYGHGTDNAQDEAVYLVFGVLQIPFDVAESMLDQALTDTDCQQVTAIIEQRLTSRQPAAYLLGEAWFCGLSFYVNEHVLVPRSPFAELINEGFHPWLPKDPARILDIGTGSGCIAISCALAFPGAEVDATDVSREALAVAQRNMTRHGVADRLRLQNSDLFSALDKNRKYDLIVSNPPYVSQADIDALPEEYHHEPVLGLHGGGDGLDLVRSLLRDAKDYLTEDGLIIVEVGLMQEVLSATLPQLPFIWLEFEYGGEGVFLLNASDLQTFS